MYMEQELDMLAFMPILNNQQVTIFCKKYAW